MESLPKTMREFSPVTYAMAKNDLERDRIEHERLIGRRDMLRDKLRSGLTALNGGSLVALMAALNGDGSAASWIGIDHHNARWVAGCFVIGLMAAGYAYRVAETATTNETADSIGRVGAAETRIALYESPPSDENNEKLRSALEKYAELPLVGHRTTTIEIVTLSVSQIAWTTGLLLPLISTLF